MSEFLEFVLDRLQSGLLLVLLTGIAAGAVIAITYRFYRKKHGERKFPWARTILWLLLLGYLLIVLYATVFRWFGGYQQWNLHLFRTWREAWNNFSAKSWANVLLNIAMFVPFGFLLPLFGKKLEKWYVTIPAGIGASMLIELLQLLLNRGVCDVDDLFCNSLGAVMGYFAFRAARSLFGEKGKRLKPMLCYGALALAPVVAVGGIFGAYQLKEYGNLPEAAAYRVNLDHLEWKLECTLPEVTGDIPVYRTKTMSKADCDAFAREMAALNGQEVQMVSYYQEMAYYNLSQNIMMVYYHDGSYEFGWFDYELDYGAQADRETVEQALQRYSIMVPEAAEFRAEQNGCYSFTCDEVTDGDQLLDGTLRVQLGTDGSVQWIENRLVCYTHHKNVPVISPEKAYEQLKNGEFGYAEALKHDASNSVNVISCVLDYEIDTKGFYQSVYRFEVLIPETGNICSAMIPAMK